MTGGQGSTLAGARDGGHLVMLDALRGIAALLVVAHHLEKSGVELGLFPRAYLAVDFFFMLSGFVLSRAYDHRFASGLDLGGFMRIRLRRLWPTMAVGIALGAAVAWGGGMPPGLLAIRAVAHLLFIPLAIGTTQLFMLDGVQWSLLFELFANAVHAGPLKQRSFAQLAWVLGFAVVTLFGVAWWFGDLTVGHVHDGWYGGFARVIASYVAGMLLYRLWCRHGQAAWPVRAGLSGIGLVVALIVPGLAPRAWWWVDPLAVATAFPLVLWWGATARVAPRWVGPATLAGAISYPLYAFHLPLLALGERLGDAIGGGGAAAFRIGGIAVAIGLALLWSRADPGLPRLALSRAGASRRSPA